jgi:hypothetical protein
MEEAYMTTQAISRGALRRGHGHSLLFARRFAQGTTVSQSRSATSACIVLEMSVLSRPN